MGGKRKKWWFPPLDNKKKPGPNDVVTIDGDEEDFDTVMAREVNANYELRDRLFKKLSIDVIDGFTDLVPDGNGGYTLEPSPQLPEMYPGLTLDQMKANLEVKLEYGIDTEPTPPQVSEEQEEEAAMMGIEKPVKRVKRSMWGRDAVFSYDTCQKSFNNWPSLQRHRYTHTKHADKYPCQVCGKKFDNSLALRNHRRSHINDPDKYECQVCHKKFSNSLNLCNHRRQHVNNANVKNPEKYVCQVCERKFPSSKSLCNHRVIHVNNPEKYKCQVCEKKFRNSKALRNHRPTHVNDPDKHVCKVCEKKFPNSISLHNHRRQHSRQRGTYECDVCNKVCKNARGLATHRRTHKNACTSRKKRTAKKKKDQNAPKRPQSVFFLWMNANREQMKKKYPDLSVTDVGKNAGEIWTQKIKWAKSSPPVHHQQDKQKSNQPRTIHIDVYCTGSDVSTNTEDNSSSEGSTSTPQTVYESSQYKIAHHCKKKQMPLCFTSNVADLVNLATNQIKLQQHHHRQDKGGRVEMMPSSSATGGRGSAGNVTTNSVPTNGSAALLDHVTKTPNNNKLLNNKSNHPTLNEGSLPPPPPPLGMMRRDFLGRDVTQNLKLDQNDSISYCDSLSSLSYPSSLGISRNTTATSFSSDWTQVDLNDVAHPQHRVDDDDDVERGVRGRGGGDEIDEGLSQEFLFSSKSRSLDSVSIAKSYEYSDSLEGGSPSTLHKDDSSQHSFPNPQHSEQWWMDYIFKKFSLKDRENIKLLGSPLSSQRSRPVGKETTNLIKMKRLSFPNCDLVDGLNTEDIMLPPFMPVVPNEADQGDTLLVTATKFGSVVKGFKKPGHHITGPTKNPNCPCQHCRYHFEEKESGGV